MTDYGAALPDMPLDPYDDPRQAAKRKLIIPAIALIFVGICSVLLAIGTSLTAGSTKDNIRRQLRNIEANRDLPPEAKRGAKWYFETYESLMPVFNGLSAICGAMIAIGGYNMTTLSSRWTCFLASILSILPFANCCCCLSMIFGVWAIIALNLPDVRAGFSYQSHLLKNS